MLPGCLTASTNVRKLQKELETGFLDSQGSVFSLKKKLLAHAGIGMNVSLRAATLLPFGLGKLRLSGPSKLGAVSGLLQNQNFEKTLKTL